MYHSIDINHKLIVIHSICFFFLLIYRNWNKQTTKPGHRSLLTVIFATFWKDYTFLAFICFFNDIVLRLGQRFLLGYLLQYFRVHPTITYDEAICYAIGILALNFFSAIFNNHIMFISFHYGLKVRVAVCSLIYRKVNLSIITL